MWVMQITSFATNLNASSIFDSNLNSYPDESFSGINKTLPNNFVEFST